MFFFFFFWLKLFFRFFFYSAYSFVYEVKKIGGSDDGVHYALKAVNITYAREADLKHENSYDTLQNLVNERKVMLKIDISYLFGNFILYSFRC